MKKTSFSGLVVCSLIALAAQGCSSSDAKTQDPAVMDAGAGAGGQSPVVEDSLTVLSWWKAPGEAEALQALLDTYQGEYPDVHVATYDDATSDNWRMVLNEHLKDSPWDVYQVSASDVESVHSDNEAFLTSVDDIYAEPTLKKNVIKQIHDATVVDGVSYGVVTGVHRNNSFLYNKQILDAQGLAPPESLDEFMALCAKLKKKGITPVAAIFQSWAMRIMLDEFMAGTMGAQGFADFLASGAPPTDADVQANITTAIDDFDLVLTDYIDVAKSKDSAYGVFEAAESLHSGDAVMYFHGDWAKGYLVSVGWTGGVDFGVSGPPGATDLFIYGADMFSMPVSAQHPNNAHDFLTMVASKKAQIAFNRFKGATPMRVDARDGLDQPGKLALDNLVGAKVLMKGHPNDAWDAALAAYAMDGDKAALTASYMTEVP